MGGWRLLIGGSIPGLARALEVLVIDDDPVFGDGLEEMLAGLGLAVRVERLTKDAILKLVAGQVPDLVLIKLEQKDMPTRAACLGMRGTPGMRRTPLLVYSAAPASEAAPQVKQCGAHGLLTVPFSPSRIVQWLQGNRDYFGPEVEVPVLPDQAALTPRQVVTALDPSVDPEEWTGEDLTPAPQSGISTHDLVGAVSGPPPAVPAEAVGGTSVPPRPEDEVAAIEAAIRAAAEEELSEIQSAIQEAPVVDEAAPPPAVPSMGEAPREPAMVVEPAAPAAPPPPGVIAPTVAAVPSQTLDPAAAIPVLLVDDEELVLEMVADMLEEDGYDIHKVQDLPSFRKAISVMAFGAIVLDVRLTDAGGGEKIAEYVAQFVEDPKPRIYLHSGLPEEELKMLALELRVEGYLCKGCGEEAVRAAVNKGVTDFAQEWLALEEGGWK